MQQGDDGSMGAVDLFGNVIEEKALTSTQRITTRQAVNAGRDLYTTEQYDIERFMRVIKNDGLELPSPIWEPAAGHGDISKVLEKHGHKVVSTDIIPYEDQEIKIKSLDFLSYNSAFHGVEFGTIFTNPPFNTQEEFLEHALSFSVDVVFFVRLSFLSSIRRHKIYARYNPAYVYVYSARAHCYKGGDINKGQNMIDYCIIIWRPPYKNETLLRWIA
jgi:hypothetical protein